jgi:hypothetical protein
MSLFKHNILLKKTDYDLCKKQMFCFEMQFLFPFGGETLPIPVRLWINLSSSLFL